MSWLAALLVFGCLLVPQSVYAFSDPELFAQPAEQGGGGGRYFTGSPADGHACSACHRGGTEPQLTILGMPDEFEVGASYQVTLRWDHPELSHGLQLELLTEFGQSPVVELPPVESLTAAARCESSPDGDPAVYIVMLERRRIIGVRDCGASEVSFRFVAPAARRLAFAASVVRSDSKGTPEGDGVYDLRHVSYARGQRPKEAGCSTLGSRGDSCHDLTLLGLMLSLVARAYGRSYSATRARQRVWRSLSCLLALSAVLPMASCYVPEFSADYVGDAEPRDLRFPWLEQEDAGTGFTSMDAAAQPELDARAELPDARITRPTKLTFRVSTGAVGGRYAPRNIGAIWIEDEGGAFVKTLKRWALTRAMYLRRFQAASGGDLTDAVTSATLNMHEQHEVTWNLRGRSGLEISEGNYRLIVELTDKDSSGLSIEVPFVKGSDPVTLRPEGTTQFRSLELILE